MFSNEKLNSVLASCDFFNAMKDMKQNQLLCFMTLISRHFKREGPILLHHGNNAWWDWQKQLFYSVFSLISWQRDKLMAFKLIMSYRFWKTKLTPTCFIVMNEQMKTWICFWKQKEKKPWMKRVIPK